MSLNKLRNTGFIAVRGDDFRTLCTPRAFRDRIYELISASSRRIYITALYLQDDDGGRGILKTIYEAKEKNPALDVKIFVDFHRAQRGLIGAKESAGNQVLYQEYESRWPGLVQIYGVPVRRYEMMGVLHLKGFVFDDTVLYSGASLNDVYLNEHGRYRMDRYQEIVSPKLADSLVGFCQKWLIGSDAVRPLSRKPVPTARYLGKAIRKFRLSLKSANYEFAPDSISAGEVGVAPLIGFGKKNVSLNRCIIRLLRSVQKKTVICTPYFNPPRAVLREINRLLQNGASIELLVGDRTASDFYIPPEEPFKKISVLPYIYEMSLRSFMEANSAFIESGQLAVRLWKDGDNTYHVKGIFTDSGYDLATGNNLNPRAWGLDLENGILIHDPEDLLREKFDAEIKEIEKHTTVLRSYTELEEFEKYPEEVQKFIRRIGRFKADFLLKKLI